MFLLWCAGQWVGPRLVNNYVKINIHDYWLTVWNKELGVHFGLILSKVSGEKWNMLLLSSLSQNCQFKFKTKSMTLFFCITTTITEQYTRIKSLWKLPSSHTHVFPVVTARNSTFCTIFNIFSIMGPKNAPLPLKKKEIQY